MKPSLPKGTRDFSPIEVAKRNYIMQIIKHNFEKYGFQPIETPSFENSETLMGKYGEEGDRLIFKILNSGDYLKDFNKFLYYLYLIFDEETLTDYFKATFKLFLNSNPADVSLLKIHHKNFIENRIAYFGISLPIELSKILSYLRVNSFAVDELNLLYKNSIEFKSYFIREPENLFVSRFKIEINGFINKILDKYLQLITNNFSEKALRYDLTVPFARYVVQHQNEIEFPFKRYQIQPVWRADRPQKGRFREFYQCDADVVGSTSLWQEVELVQLYDAVFSELGLEGITIKINNRKILSGIAEVIGASDKLIDFTVALDKLDKIGEDGVKKEMLEKGISQSAIDKVQPLFEFTGTISEKISKLSQLLASSVEGMKGVAELQFICENVTQLGLQKSFLDLDVTLARGLNYYTGAIFEVEPPKGVSMGSIGGGGRYDDLTGIFGLKNMSGVGISFGLDRIYLVLEELKLFPEKAINGVKVLFLNNGETSALETMKAIHKLRNLDIQVDFYPDASKIDKQFKHAEKRQIPFVVKEIKGENFILKNLVSGLQEEITFENLVLRLQ